MAYKDGVDLFPLQIQHFQGNLCTFPAIEEKELSIPTNHGTRKKPIGKGHHAAGPEYKHFKIHKASIPKNIG
jgi:hypothetical protein